MAKLEVTLKQHTPLIHFESDIEGATLRATELKPKLDKFLIECFKEEEINYSKYLIKGQKKAFNYKVKIKNIKGWKKEQINEKFPLFFGNTGVEEESEKKFFVSCNTLDVEFFSFYKELVDLIELKLLQFLLTTNFGTRQSKGFGSFFIEKEFKNLNLLEKEFKYHFQVETNDIESVFEKIETFYKSLRSGLNYNKINPYIEKYCREKLRIKWDKQVIKEEFFNENKINGTPFLVKDLFGLSSLEQWKHQKNEIKKKEKDNKIDRFKSPIFFKILKEKRNLYKIYFRFNDIDKEFLNKEFIISNKQGNSFSIKTPKEFSFDKFFGYILEQPTFIKQVENIFIQIKNNLKVGDK